MISLPKWILKTVDQESKKKRGKFLDQNGELEASGGRDYIFLGPTIEIQSREAEEA